MEMRTNMHFHDRLHNGQKDYLPLLVASRDVSAFWLECLHEWVIKCQAGLEE